MNSSTIPKSKIFDSFVKDSYKIPFCDALYEWYSNSTYSNSSNSLTYVKNDNGKMSIFYAFDTSNDQINLNNLISFKSSHNIHSEIGHHGDGFKRFSFKHLGKMEIYSINSDQKTYQYLCQEHLNLKNKLEEGMSNSEFERTMDNSNYTIFSKTIDIEDMPRKISKFIDDKNLPFTPKFVVKFSNLKNNIEEYVNHKLYESLVDVISFINYQHLDKIYIKNEFQSDVEFVEIKGFDIRGDNKENVNLEIKYEMYQKNEKYYILVDDNCDGEFLYELEGKERIILDSDEIENQNLIHMCNITIRELKPNYNKKIKDKLNSIKSNKRHIPTSIQEQYAGIYIILNDIPINYLPCKNDLIKSGTAPGRSRYRCIVEPVSNEHIDKMILTEGIKSNSKLSDSTNWKLIIKENINKIFEKYMKTYTENYKVLNPPERPLLNPIPEVKTEHMSCQRVPSNTVKYKYLFILKLSPETYHYSWDTSNPFAKKEKIIKKFQDSNSDLNIYDNIDMINFISVLGVAKNNSLNIENFFVEKLNLMLHLDHLIEEDRYFTTRNLASLYSMIGNFYEDAIATGFTFK